MLPMRLALPLPLLLLLLVLLQGCHGDDQEPLRHVDDCGFCFDCIVTDTAPAGAVPRSVPASAALEPTSEYEDGGASSTAARRLLKHGGTTAAWRRGLLGAAPGSGLTPESFVPGSFDTALKSSLPNCTRCWGCTTTLSSLAPSASFLGRTFKNEAGATSSWVFKATTNRTARGSAVVKIYCMPLPKRPGAKIPNCSPVTILRNMHTLLGIQLLVDECGFGDIVPRVWVERVSAVIPGLGYHVRWYGLWMEIADGISMENFLHRGEPERLTPPVILDMLQNKMNKTQVVRGAIFDLLTSQCDRHAQNIFITETGELRLIDNEAALQANWKNCGVDSIMVPGTQKFTIVRLSNQFVVKLVGPEGAVKDHADPQVLFDYRCYVAESGALGSAYPPQVKQCLTAIAGLSAQAVQDKYGFQELLPAENLLARAQDMLTKGHEWACKYGKPLNADSKRYRIPPKCCQVVWDGSMYKCGHAWAPKYEVPVGNPFGGGPWVKPRADPGTYKGGEFDD